MELQTVKTLWGVPDAANTEKWDSMFARIAADGFSCVESICLTWQPNPELFVSLLSKHKLKLICQIHTAGGYIENGEYIYCSSDEVEDHVSSFRSQLAVALGLGAIMINSHSGHDSWTLPQATLYFTSVLQIEAELLVGSHAGAMVVHETHRQRLLHSPFQARDILAQPELSKLKINADLSHWVCVCEHVFDPDEKRDSWWPSVLTTVAKHCYFIHARFGHAEGPQIYDPRTPSIWDKEVAAHLQWWRTIWQSQRSMGCPVAYVECEHGPAPYQVWTISEHTPDFDKDEELWRINKWVIQRVSEAFAALQG